MFADFALGTLIIAFILFLVYSVWQNYKSSNWYKFIPLDFDNFRTVEKHIFFKFLKNISHDSYELDTELGGHTRVYARRINGERVAIGMVVIYAEGNCYYLRKDMFKEEEEGET